MTQRNQNPGVVMDALANRTIAVLTNELGIAVNHVSRDNGRTDLLELRSLTAIVGLGGEVNLLIAFSFDGDLAEQVRERMTADLGLPDTDLEHWRHEAAAELINTAVGNATSDLQEPPSRLHLTPPVIITEAKQITRTKDAMFCRVRLETASGNMDIDLAGPKELFDSELNYIG